MINRLPRTHLLVASSALAMVVGGLLFSPSSTGSVDRVSIEVPVTPAGAADTVSAPGSTLHYQTPAVPPAADAVQTGGGDAVAVASSDEGDAAQTVSATISATEETVAPDAQPAPAALTFRTEAVGKGDSLSVIFQRAGASAAELLTIDKAMKDRGWAKLYPGEKVVFGFDSGGKLKALTLHRSPLEQFEVSWNGSGFEGKQVVRQPDIQLAYAEGEIRDSLFVDASRAGLPDKLIMELANIFGWDIDFIQDIREGDRFRVVYEEKYLGEKKIGLGGIVAAEFVNQGKSYKAIRYTDSNGRTAYYTPDGRSMRKAFLRMPVDFARISSGFNLRRKHPVLNRIRAHKGTDYAAARGTPIKASGDGRVIFAGRKGGYGNTVIIRHGQAITTLYAHMQKFARGIRSGKTVRQGQVIGYIGSTGLATGPHLHYEFRVNGVHKNPMTVALPEAAPVPKSERKRFEQVASLALQQLDSLGGSMQIARATTTDAETATH